MGTIWCRTIPRLYHPIWQGCHLNSRLICIISATLFILINAEIGMLNYMGIKSGLSHSIKIPNTVNVSRNSYGKLYWWHTCCPAVISRLYPPPKNFFWVYPPPRRSKFRLTKLDTNFLAPAFLNPAGDIFPAEGWQKSFLLSNPAGLMKAGVFFSPAKGQQTNLKKIRL